MDWISQNSSELQVLMTGLMVLIWIAYLQIFLISFRRQRRPAILISLGAGAGVAARCFITNLGLEPSYLMDVIVEIEADDGTHRAVVTDRTELTDKELNSPGEATNQGPLGSGHSIDIGGFETLVKRAWRKDHGFRTDREIKSVELTAVAATAADGSIIGAKRKYEIQADAGGRIHLRAMTVSAKQIYSRLGRRALREEILSQS